MFVTLGVVVERVVALAGQYPLRRAARPAEWERIAPHILDGKPNTLLANAIGPDAAVEHSWPLNTARAGELVSMTGDPLDPLRVAWLEKVSAAEDSGHAWRKCITIAGEPPNDTQLKAPGMSAIPAEDGLYSGIGDVAYHADRGSLSSSGARKLLPPSCPAIFRAAQDLPPERKPQYDFGHVAHKYVLGVGEGVDIIDAKDWTTKAARESRDASYEAGRIPILKAENEKAEQMAAAFYEHEIAAALLSEGEPELSGYWHDPETGVRLRVRPDWLRIGGSGRPVIVDYKTSKSSDTDDFARSAGDYGYHIQAPFYIDGVEAVAGVDDPAFVFVVQSKTPPFPVNVIELDADAIDLGRRLARRAIGIYAQCMETNEWPDYPHGIHRVSLPTYLAYQQEAILA